jgi:soluble epoxide hydrolase/lipid-phosphate phosphatase
MFPQARIIEANGINMAVHEQGDGTPILFVHGFPELAYSWRYQLPAIAAAGYRVIAPDMRGYGGTDKPQGIEQYTVQKLIGDIEGLLDALDIERAHVVAHDWGALLAWQLALLAPQRMLSLTALNIPFFPRAPIDPIEIMRAALGKDFYIVNFQDSDEADRRCAEDPERVFEVMMRKNVISRERFNTLPKEMRSFSLLAALSRTELSGDPLLSPEEAQVYAEAFAAGGFTAPINWYRNWSQNWASSTDVKQVVTVPTLFIEAVDDVIISPQQISAMKPHVPDLEIRTLEHCGHWSQQEKPAEVNALLLDWLSARSG